MNQEAVVLNTPFTDAPNQDVQTEVDASNSLPNGQTIRDCVAQALENYFSHLKKDEDEVFEVYQMVMAEVEAPLLETVMKHTDNNQTRSSEILGINRGTLRKKLKQYDML